MDIKVYVEVNVSFSTEGIMTPRSLIWEDGTEYEIARVLDVRRLASTKAGGVGDRYLCIVDGKQMSLFYEGNGRWFVERASK